MSSQTPVILITGGNTGLGFEVVRALAQCGTAYNVIIGCRRPSSGEQAITSLQQELPNTPCSFSVTALDLESDATITKAHEFIVSTYGRLDVLINNGGASFDGALGASELGLREAWTKTWDVNVSGTMVLTSTLIPLLLKAPAPRLLFLTSGTSSMTETEDLSNPVSARINGSPAKGWPKDHGMNPITIYRSAKTGLNMAMREWHRLLKEDGVKVHAISPGFLATGLGGVGKEQLLKMGAQEPAVGGNFIKDVVQGKYDDQVGKVIRKDMIQPW